MRNPSVLKTWVAFSVLAVLAGGCGEVRVNVIEGEVSPKPFRVAVLDFEWSADPVETVLGGQDVHEIDNAGSIVADAVSVALVDVPQLQVVEGARLKQVIAELKLTPDDALTPENLKKVAQAAEIDGVVVGRVSDFHWWQVALCSGTDLAFTARMVNATSGQVLWSAAVRRSRRRNHSRVLFDACAAMAGKLANELER